MADGALVVSGATWGIAALATGGVILRPWRLPEALWAVLGAAALVGFGLISTREALVGVTKGIDVYLFLTGMMLLSELAREESLFDWLAALAAEHARGSPQRLFAMIYAVGVVVTVFLSNDATAVVLTPAVYAATRAAGATPLPYLLICAFIANAASFVLPISNPANLVIYAEHMPPLLSWLAQFVLPSFAAIVVTYLALRLTQHRTLRRERITAEVPRPELKRSGRMIAVGIGATAIVLLLCSAFNVRLGLPTFCCGVATALAVLLLNRQPPWSVIRGISWGVLPLVAGLFVLVEGLVRTGVIGALTEALHAGLAHSITSTAWASGLIVAVASNLTNNLPTGLVASSVIAATPVPPPVSGAMLIGVDIGPNLSVTGSLATLLWLTAIRREGLDVGALSFLAIGTIVMPPALLLALAALIWL